MDSRHGMAGKKSEGQETANERFSFDYGEISHEVDADIRSFVRRIPQEVLTARDGKSAYYNAEMQKVYLISHPSTQRDNQYLTVNQREGYQEFREYDFWGVTAEYIEQLVDNYNDGIIISTERLNNEFESLKSKSREYSRDNLPINYNISDGNNDRLGNQSLSGESIGEASASRSGSSEGERTGMSRTGDANNRYRNTPFSLGTTPFFILEPHERIDKIIPRKKMFSILAYILLPIIFLIHDIEEIVTRKRWAEKRSDSIVERYPVSKRIITHLKEISTKRFCIIVGEEFLLLFIAAVMAIYGQHYPIIALMWGFCIHLAVHIIQAIVFRGYIPGVATSVMLIPYSSYVIVDMIGQFELKINIICALSGMVIVVLNLIVMHWLMKR